MDEDALMAIQDNGQSNFILSQPKLNVYRKNIITILMLLPNNYALISLHVRGTGECKPPVKAYLMIILNKNLHISIYILRRFGWVQCTDYSFTILQITPP